MVRRLKARSVALQGLAVLLPCALIEFIAGFTFKSMQSYLQLLPGLLVMVPPLLGLRGNINGALASRLGTALHTGMISPKLKLTAEVKVNLASSLILSLLASATIGVLAFASCALTGLETISVFKLIAIAAVAGFLSALVLSLMTLFVAVESYLRGVDPDNVTSPVMATAGDFVTMVCIFLAVFLLG